MKEIHIILIFLIVSLPLFSQDKTSPRKQMEDSFIERMKEMSRMDILSKVSPDTSVMSRAEGKKYYILPGDTYIIDEISSATYYNRKGKHYIPLCDGKYPAETIANRLLLPNKELPDGEMNLSFQKYRYQKDSVKIQFKQFLAFCRQEGYDPYVGIEHMDEKEMKIDLFVYNYKNKWLHVFNLNCPIENVADRGLTISGKGLLFIPTSNIRELMGKELPPDFMEKLMKKTKNR